MFAQVILSKAIARIDQVFDYEIPEELKDSVKIGAQVLIPFGNRKDIGYVIGLADKTTAPKVKKILSVTSESLLFSKQSVGLARWMADRYFSFFISALRSVMPPGLRQSEVKKRGH